MIVKSQYIVQCKEPGDSNWTDYSYPFAADAIGGHQVTGIVRYARENNPLGNEYRVIIREVHESEVAGL